MRTSLCVVAIAVLGVGCASTRPLSSVPQAKAVALYVDSGSKTNVELVFSTVRGRNAELAGSTGGLVGAMVGNSVAAGAENRGARLLTTLRTENENCETPLVLSALKSRLTDAGIQTTADAAVKARLLVVMQSVGLQENQRGYWVLFLHLNAEFTNDGKEKIWRTFVTSTGTRPRALEDYTINPLLYGKDFVEVAEDVARQLVIGPIRH